MFLRAAVFAATAFYSTFADAEGFSWSGLLGRSPAVALDTLKQFGECDQQPLKVSLPTISENTELRRNFHRPLSGNLFPYESRIVVDHGVRVLRCNVGPASEANLYYSDEGLKVFLISVSVDRCMSRTVSGSCLKTDTRERSYDKQLSKGVDNQRLFSFIGHPPDDSDYLTSYVDIMNDPFNRQHLFQSDCVRFGDLRSYSGKYRCLVDARIKASNWRSTSFWQLFEEGSFFKSERIEATLVSQRRFIDLDLEHFEMNKFLTYFESILKEEKAQKKDRSKLLESPVASEN